MSDNTNNKEKKEENTKYIFLNYRCRKCGALVSKQMPERLAAYSGNYGVTASNKTSFHKHCKEGIEDGEHVYFDLISRSRIPLANAVDISFYDPNNTVSKSLEAQDEFNKEVD